MTAPPPTTSSSLNVLVLDDWEGLLASSAGVRAMRERGHRVRVLGRGEPLARVDRGTLEAAHVLVAVRERTRLDGSALDLLPRLRLLLQTGGHAYHVDLGACTARGVVVVLGRRVTAPRAAVPELSVMLMIAAFRRLGEVRVDAGGWPTARVGRTLRGKQLGLVGAGRIGAHVARIASAMGMRVVAWGRPGAAYASGPEAAPDDQRIPRLPLDELLLTSDVVSLHLRLAPETRRIISRDALRRMKPSAVLINTSRGDLVDEDALADALREGWIAGAGLDVFREEPLPSDSPLRSLRNVVMTPHIGWIVEESFTEFADIAAEQLRDFVAGRVDVDEVANPRALEVNEKGPPSRM